MDGGGASGSSLGVGGYDYGGAAGLVGMKQRNGRGREKGAGGQPSDEKERVIGLGLSVEESGGRVDVVVKHYDADGQCTLDSAPAGCMLTIVLSHSVD